MAHFALLWKARTVEKYRLIYENEKINSIAMADIELPKKTVLQKWRHYRFDTQKRISKTFRQLYPEGSSLSNFIIYLKTKQTYTNIIVKATFGFIGGYVLSYLCFIFFVYQLSISVVYATVLSFIIGILLTLGLAFSNRIRCLVFLLIPQFFSRFGRYTLTCFALVLILTGPATNTLKNSEVLSESMACSQEQIKTSLNNLNESMKKPHNFLKDSIKLIVEKTNEIAFELKGIMSKINRLTLTIVSAIQMNFAWLKSIAADCNHKLGTPYQHCATILKNSITYCEEVFGAVSQLCDVTYLAHDACAHTKPFEAFCEVSEFVDDCFLATVRRRLRDFLDRIKAMMDVKVTRHHSYLFSANASGSASQVAAGIVTEIRNRADPLLTWLSWSSCVTSLFLLLIIFRAKYYQHMYETRSRFDNRYVTKELRDLDLKRLREGRETILPLNRREKAKYINITSFRLLTSERRYWSRSVVFMTITTFKLLIHMVADYSLYWVLVTIRYHGSFQTPLRAELPRAEFHVSDVGFVARLVKSILSVLEIPLAKTDSPASCLPNPNPPDFRRYSQIGMLIFLLWFFALFEPYGLRLRHVIMTHYRPERARERAVWLYNHILRTRGSFLKFARRKLHREYKYRAQTKSIFRICLCAYLPFDWLRSLLGAGFEEAKCLLCGTIQLKTDSDTQLIRCESTDCVGTYCTSCFAEIGQLCTICLSPEDYGDTSDVSLERGSSEENSESDDDNDEIKNSRSNTPKRTYNETNEDKKNTKSNKYCNFFPVMNQNNDKYPLLPGHKMANILENEYNKHRWHKGANNSFVVDNHTSTLKIKEISIFYESDTRFYYLLNKRAIIYSLTPSPYYDRKHNKSVLQFYQIHNFKYFVTNKIYDFEPSVMIIKNIKCVNGIRNSNARLVPSRFTALLLERFNFYEVKKTNSLTIIRRKSPRCLLSCLIPKQYRKKRTKFNGTKTGLRSNRNKSNFIKLSRSIITQQNYIGVNNSTSTLCCGNRERKKVQHNNRDKNKTDKTQKRKCNKKADNDNKLKNGNLWSHVRRLISLNTICSTYWNNIKIQNTSCSNISKINTKFPSCNQKKNHKRRKKLIRIFPCKTSDNIEPKDDGDARKFRISAYFFDQDWFKRKYEVNPNISKKQHDSNKTSKYLEDFTPDNQLELKEAPPAIQIAKCTSSRVLKIYDPKTEIPHVCNNNDTYQLKNKRRSKLDTTKKALERFRNRIAQRLHKGPSSKNVVVAPINSSTKRINYFKSIVNDDLDSIDEIFEETEGIFCNRHDRSYISNENIYPRTHYAIEECTDLPVCDKCMLTVADSSQTSRGSSRIDIICNKSKKCSCNKSKKVPRIKTPLKCMRKLCVSLFGSLADEEASIFKKGNKANKGVNVFPSVKSFSCQCTQVKLIRDHATQVGRMPPEILHDAATSNINPTCTCATQPVVTTRNVGTWLGHHCNELHRAATEHKRKMLYDKSDSTVDTNDSSINECLNCLKSESPIGSNDSKTDTTICSVATVEYREERKKKGGKTKSKVVTKTNRSTLTEKPKVSDVSTITNDWWSPIAERNKGRVEKKKEDYKMNETQKLLRNRGMTTDGRIVMFKSRTQVIPPGTTDIMTPSRYLLESQKYYNELFSSKFYTPHMYMLTQTQKHQESDKNRSPTSIRYHTRRGFKNKKQDESCSKKNECVKVEDFTRKRVQTNIFKQHKFYGSTPRPHYGQKPKAYYKKKHRKEAHDNLELDKITSNMHVGGSIEAVSCNSTNNLG